VLPKLLYDLRELTTYAPAERIADLVQHLHAQERCVFFANLREDGRWVPRALGAAEAVARILGAERGRLVPYLWLYAMPVRLEVPDEVWDAKKEAAWWKRHEVIRISAPFNIGGSTMYYLQFANERVEGEAVQSKSEAFRALTQRLLEHLAEHFVSWRGASSFDDVEEHRRAFGERFRKAAQEA
jgi:hypothetical protein